MKICMGQGGIEGYHCVRFLALDVAWDLRTPHAHDPGRERAAEHLLTEPTDHKPRSEIPQTTFCIEKTQTTSRYTCVEQTRLRGSAFKY